MKLLTKINNLAREYPPQFWTLTGASFIDSLGGTILFPFFALYITQRFGIGMTQAGILLAIFSFTGLIGGLAGGALADRLGSKIMIMAGLLLSAGSSLVMGFINELYVFYIVAAVVGLLADIGRPAREAMIADLLPEEKRGDGFGIFRVMHNLAWVIGPSIGGFLASRSYLNLFITDAVMSSITALVILRFIKDTKPSGSSSTEGGRHEGLAETFAGYSKVLKNSLFVSFLLISLLMLLVYQQLYSTFSVFLRDCRGFSEGTFGLMMSMNAVVVVVFQLIVSRIVSRHNPFLMLALGTLFYLIGYTSFGFIYGLYFFFGAVLFITVGEMIMVPVQMSIVAKLAPEDMRGRYMAASGFSWSIASMAGPWAAGLIMDNYDPNLVWKICGIFSLLAVAGFFLLFLRTRKMKDFQKAAEQPVE